MNPWEHFSEHLAEQHTLIQLIELISWDQETYMPSKAIVQRAKQSGFLSGILHEKKTHPSFASLIESLSPEDELQKTAIQRAKHSFQRANAVPKDLVEALSTTKSIATQKWAQAKENNDLALFLPALKEVITHTKEYAACFGSSAHPYDNLLEEYDPGMTTAFLDPMFQALSDQLSPYVLEQVNTKQPDDLDVFIPKAALTRINHAIIDALGFDSDAGRLDISSHPFTVGMGPNDVRLTTRNLETDFLGSIGGTIHECGHGLYEQGLPLEYNHIGLCAAAGCGIHESQSRFYENIIGRSLPFYQWLSPIIYRESGLIIPAERLYCAANKVSRSFIRVSADETTYNLHIIVRYQLEKALLEETLSVDELNQAWNDLYTKILGITPPNAKTGLLQDIHWSAGLFGYFPSYTLGNLFSASYRYAIEAVQPNMWTDIASGNFSHILEWLRHNIHSKGHTNTQEQIVLDAVGERNHVADFMAHIRERHSQRNELI